MRAKRNIVATTRPCPISQKRREKSENQERGSGERAQHREIDGAAQELHPARKRGGQFVGRIEVRVRRSESSVLVDDPFETRDKNRQERRDGAQHEGRRRRVRNRFA
jgi:hypothetical protein